MFLAVVLYRRQEPGPLLPRIAILRVESHQQLYDNGQYLLRYNESDRNMIDCSPKNLRDHLCRVLGKCDHTNSDP